MPNSLTWCDLPEDVSLWPGLPLSLSGDEVMPLDYHAGRSGWLLYGRGLDKRRLTAWQRELGAALVIVASWVVEDYQVIRLAGSLTLRATRLAHEAGLDGVVCSAHESELIKSATSDSFSTLCPGIRDVSDEKGDQQRVVDVVSAKAMKVDFAVIGRPIYKSQNPKETLQNILNKIG